MSIPVADAHCDFLYGMVQSGYRIQTMSDSQCIHLPHLRMGGVKLQFFATWMDRALKVPFLQQCVSMTDAYYRMLQENSDILVPLTADYMTESDKIATVLTVEGGEAIEGSLAALRVLKRLGVCAMTLTWNHNNELSGAAVKKHGKGLTSLGKDVVLEMERIQMAVDVSHVSDAAIDDILTLSDATLFASHSNARAVYASPRGLEDAHIKEIARRGGVVGVNFFHKQLCDGKATIADIVRHMEHIVTVGGVNCCAIGSDFDGMVQYPVELPHSGHMQALLQGLRTLGFDEQQIGRIAYHNLRDFIVRYV